jgi:hypothetical protein
MTHSPRQLTQALERREIVQRERTDPSVFQLPVEKMRSGYYSDQYFNLTKELVEAEGRFPVVKISLSRRWQAVDRWLGPA